MIFHSQRVEFRRAFNPALARAGVVQVDFFRCQVDYFPPSLLVAGMINETQVPTRYSLRIERPY